MLDILFKGGWLMVPLVASSVLALGIIITKLIHLRWLEARSNRFIDKTRQLVRGNEERKVDKILAFCEMTVNLPLARILKAGIQKRGHDRREIMEKRDQ